MLCLIDMFLHKRHSICLPKFNCMVIIYCIEYHKRNNSFLFFFTITLNFGLSQLTWLRDCSSAFNLYLIHRSIRTYHNINITSEWNYLKMYKYMLKQVNMWQIPCNEICLNIEIQEFVSILHNYFHANLSFAKSFSIFFRNFVWGKMQKFS